MRNVAYTWQDSKKMRAFHRRDERYTRRDWSGTIWSVKSITRKNTRAGIPKIGKSRWEFVDEIFFRRRFFSLLDVLARYSLTVLTAAEQYFIVFIRHVIIPKNQGHNNMFNICFTLVVALDTFIRKNLSWKDNSRTFDRSSLEKEKFAV